jgi:hypothetical protein
MSEVRNSPSGQLVEIGAGADITVVGEVTIPALTEIEAGITLERTISLGAIVSAADARKWRLSVNLVPNDAGITPEITRTTLIWEVPGIVLGSEEVQARIGLRNDTEVLADTGEDDLVFGFLAQHFVDG